MKQQPVSRRPFDGSHSDREKMLSGELYDARATHGLVAQREHAREYNRTSEDASEERNRLLEELFGSIEGDATVEPPFRCDYGYNIHVGEGFYATVDCVVLDDRRVEFGRDCLLGPGVHVYTATHPFDAEKCAAALEYGEPVSVGGNPARVLRELD